MLKFKFLTMQEEETKDILLENEILKKENNKLRELLDEQEKRIQSIYNTLESIGLENKVNKNLLYKNKNLSDEKINETNTLTNPINKETEFKEESEILIDDMSIISFLARSNKRVEILKSLKESNKIPSTIGKDIGDSSHHVSKYLKSLKDKNLVVCLNEEDKRYRIYAITDKGEKYLNLIENNEFKI